VTGKGWVFLKLKGSYIFQLFPAFPKAELKANNKYLRVPDEPLTPRAKDLVRTPT